MGSLCYVYPNYKSKKALRDAVKAGDGLSVVCAEGPGPVPTNGVVCIAGPHYPAPHKWYAEVTLENGRVVRVK